MDSSAPSILLPRVQVPSTPSMLFSIYIVQIVYLPFEFECENNENKQKRGRDWPIFKKGSANRIRSLCKSCICVWTELQSGRIGNKENYSQSIDIGSFFLIFQYFTAHVYQFQFYRAMCLAADQYVDGDKDKPLHRCNFYGKLRIPMRSIVI